MKEKQLGLIRALGLVLFGALLFWIFSDRDQFLEDVQQFITLPTPGPTSTRSPTATPSPTPTFRYWFDKAMADLREGQYRAAIQSLDEAIRLKPNFALSYMNRGVAKGRLRLNEEAILDYSHSISLDPSDACAYRNRGITKIRLEEFQQALKDLNTAISLRSGYDEAITSRGFVKLRQEDYEGAIDNFSRAIGMRVEEGTGFKPTPCPPEEDVEKPGTPAVNTTPTSGSTATPTPTPTPNPCPRGCLRSRAESVRQLRLRVSRV